MTIDTIPEGYCQCGCGERTWVATKTRKKLGWVKGNPVRFRKGHYRRPPVPYVVDKDTDCWISQHGKDEKGYALLRINGKSRRAHQVYYERKYGPVPEGKELHHFVCQRRDCCNPDHVTPVTHTVNMREAKNTKLTMAKAREIRRRYAQGEPRRTIATSYGIDPTMVNKIVRGEYWKE